MTDLLGGRIAMYPSVPSTAQAHIDAGKLIAIATTGAKRTSLMPNVPTVAEQGYPGFEAVNWYAFVAPGKTPKGIIDYWNRELVKALNDPSVKNELAKHGLEPQPGTPQELARYIDTETEKWGRSSAPPTSSRNDRRGTRPPRGSRPRGARRRTGRCRGCRADPRDGRPHGPRHRRAAARIVRRAPASGAIDANAPSPVEEAAPAIVRIDGANALGPLVGLRASRSDVAGDARMAWASRSRATRITSARSRPTASWPPTMASHR
jgi:hypothetical protein